jgi:ferrous iron transport protein A
LRFRDDPEGFSASGSRFPKFSRIILILTLMDFRVTTMNFAPAAAAQAQGLSLSQLPDNQWATVVDVLRPESPEDRELVLRLTEIGFVPGEAVRVVASGVPGREPLAVRVGHTTFALRRHEAALIRVMPGAAGHG